MVRDAVELMSTLKGFFKESDTQLGVFYPKHYLIAVFRDLVARNRRSRVCGWRALPKMKRLRWRARMYSISQRKRPGPGIS